MQIFLEGKLLGVDTCLLAPSALAANDADRVFTGRSHWISLLSEVLPRVLLEELSLAKILLGSSGGGQSLLCYRRNRGLPRKYSSKLRQRISRS